MIVAILRFFIRLVRVDRSRTPVNAVRASNRRVVLVLVGAIFVAVDGAYVKQGETALAGWDQKLLWRRIRACQLIVDKSKRGDQAQFFEQV
jgi:hypothetical protein